ncbi:MAG: nickel insertion protein [Cloacibacillus sp.]
MRELEKIQEQTAEEEGNESLVMSEAVEMSANIDDMTGEDLGAAMEILLAAGALDVWFEAIQMKKNRPAVKLSLLSAPSEKQKFAELVLRHTTTLGVRARVVERAVLTRRERTVATRFGGVRVKCGMLAGETVKEMPEYEDIKKIAIETGLSMAAVRKLVAEDEKIQTL